jgi:hypothetical protein
MNYAFEIGSGAMIYMRSFIEIGSGIEALIGRGERVHSLRDSMVIL